MSKTGLYYTSVILLSLAIAGVVGFLIFNMSKGQFGRAALTVSTEHGSASVLVNGRSQGETPFYTEDIQASNLNIEINGETNTYSTIIRPAAATIAIVSRDLGVSSAFSSGQNLWMDKIGGEEAAVFITSPDTEEVSIIVDGVEVGKTPKRFTEKDLLTTNEDKRYSIIFRKPGYEEQEIRNVNLEKGFELNIRIDMFLRPIPEEITPISGLSDNIQFLNFANVNDSAFVDKQVWAKALNYWLQTRGAINIGNINVESISYFIDDTGNVYNSDGNSIEATEIILEEEESMTIVYLGSQETLDVTEAAKAAIDTAMGVETVVTSSGANDDSAITIRITETGIGFLRVRSGPGTGNAEVGRVSVGTELTVLEERSNWYRIEYTTGSEGWISSEYTQVVE